jgi:hypothetical protein
MATPPSLTQIAFAGGLDESQEDEILDPSRSFLVLRNTRQDKRGGLTKRLGFDAMTLARLTSPSSSRSAGYRLMEFNGEPVVIDGTYLDAYSSVAAKNLKRSRVPECSVRVLDAPGRIVADSEYCNGYIAIASGVAGYSGYTGAQAASVSVIDSNGAVVRPLEALGNSTSSIHLASFSSRYIVAAVKDTLANDISTYILDTQSLTSGWVALATITSVTNSWPSICSLSDRVAIAYGRAGAPTLGVSTLNASGVITSTTIAAGAPPPAYIGISGSTGGTLWVAYDVSLDVTVIGLNPSTLATTATAAIAITVGGSVEHVDIVEGPTNQARVLAYNGGNGTLLRASVTISAGAATPTAMTSLVGIGAASRPFYYNSRHYIACYGGSLDYTAVEDNSQAVAVLADWTNNEAVVRPVANLSPGLVVGRQFRGKFSAAASTRYVYAYETTRSGAADVLNVRVGYGSGASVAVIDFADRHRWQAKTYDGRLYMSGGVVSAYDGETVSEVGFLHAPAAPTTGTSGTGITGTFKYVAIYEEVDCAGVRTVSGVSSPSASVSPANQTVAVTTAGIGITSRIGTERIGTSRTRIVFYRTLTGGEPPYYRLGTVNCLGAISYTYNDSTTDATLATYAKLYAPNLPGTAGEAQDRRAPPALSCIESYNGMLVGCARSSVFYSGQQVYGEATWFSPLFEVPIPDAGDVKAVKALDGTLFVFKEQSIYAVAGEPPTDNGASGGLGTPRIIATDVGCSEVSSLVSTSLGIFFQSRRGIELLTRAGQVVWIGEAIQRTLASYPVVSSAVLDAPSSLVRFSLAASESSGLVSGNGVDVVYDLTLQTWISVDDKTTGPAATTLTPSQDACMVKVSDTWRYAWLTTDGTVRYERLSSDASAHIDDTNWITMSVETAWFKTAGLQGNQQLNRLLFLARKSTDHKLSISLAYNYETSYRSARQWTHTEIASLLSSGWPITQLKHDPHDDAECQAVRVKISDAVHSGGTTGTGKGSKWLGLTLDITPKPGVFDVPEGAS